MEHEALEILDTLHYGNVITHEDYSRLHDLVECLIGDNESTQNRNKFLLDKLNTIREITK
jgi:hypothetical protein